mgnify:CR=1 FL=1
MNKAIIFDMGGVLVDLDIEGCKDTFRRELDYQNIDKIIDPCHQKGIWGDLEEGVLSAEEFRKTVLAESRPGATDKDVDEAMSKILVGIAQYKADLLRKMKEGYEIFNVGTGRPVSVYELVTAFEKVNDLKLNYKYVDRRPGDVMAIWADTTLANEELGWKAERTVEETLASAWAWERHLAGI